MRRSPRSCGRCAYELIDNSVVGVRGGGLGHELRPVFEFDSFLSKVDQQEEARRAAAELRYGRHLDKMTSGYNSLKQKSA